MKLTILALIFATPPAAAADGHWNSAFNNGVMEYSTGIWDAHSGGALSLSCKDEQITIMAQIAGKTPPAGSTLQITASSREGRHTMRFVVDGGGGHGMPVRAPEASELWRALRTNDTATLRYADGRVSVVSLDGAAATLPKIPCG